ncbi:MAG: hypothetical protein J6P81_00335 [Spirochaetales bacterium]|nr:hypothetical protein [Spirochaetales bacterium]MBO7349865.1 hypothetical protein [Spirochaetales bacterium]
MASKNRNQDDGKKLTYVILEIWKHKLWIFFLMFVAFAAFAVHSGLHAEDSVSARLVLRYEHAYEGLNPNGSRFNINELSGDEVLSKSISLAGLEGELSLDQLKKSLSVTSSGSQEPKKMYIATEYSISLTNKYLPKRISARSMLGIILQTYKNYFLDHYGKNDGVLDIDWSETEAWEYVEFANIMEVKIDNIITYLETMQTESGTYNYQTEGETFRSLADSVVSFRDIYLNKYTAYVTNNNLFRNPERYRDKLIYRRFLISQAAQGAEARYKIRQDALTMYDKAMITFVMIPVYDKTNGLQMTRTGTGMDDLTVSSMDFAKILESNTEELKLIDKAIERTYAAETDIQKYITANTMISEMKQNVNSLIQRIGKVLHDYEESSFKNSIYFNIAEDSISSAYRIKASALVALLAGLVASAWYGVAATVFRKEEEKV